MKEKCAVNKHQQGRIASLDYIRVIALILVIVIHCAEINWNLSTAGILNLTIPVRIFTIILYNMGRLSVPVFLFLTGYLMLDRKYTKQDIKKFYKTNVKRLLIAYETWLVIYYLFFVALGWLEFNLVDIISQMLFMGTGVLAPHLWYMSVIIGIYIFIPFIANSLKIASWKTIRFILLVAIFYLLAVPTINNISSALGLRSIVSQLDLSYIGGIYGVYLLIGYCFKKYSSAIMKKINSKIVAVIFAISFVCAVIYHYVLSVVLQYRPDIWYDSLFILLASTCLFILAMRLFARVSCSEYIAKVSGSVFGLYLIHYLIIYLVRIVAYKISPMYGSVMGFVVVLLATTGACGLIVIASSKLPHRLTKYLGFTGKSECNKPRL